MMLLQGNHTLIFVDVVVSTQIKLPVMNHTDQISFLFDIKCLLLLFLGLSFVTSILKFSPCLLVSMFFIFEGFHMNNKLSSIFPESCLLIILGIIGGILIYFSLEPNDTESQSQYTLHAATFFQVSHPRPVDKDLSSFIPRRSPPCWLHFGPKTRYIQ